MFDVASSRTPLASCRSLTIADPGHYERSKLMWSDLQQCCVPASSCWHLELHAWAFPSVTHSLCFHEVFHRELHEQVSVYSRHEMCSKDVKVSPPSARFVMSWPTSGSLVPPETAFQRTSFRDPRRLCTDHFLLFKTDFAVFIFGVHPNQRRQTSCKSQRSCFSNTTRTH